MREDSFDLNEALKNGLRPETRLQRSEAYLDQCVNLVPSQWGLVEAKTITNPFTSETVAWPFPQYFRGMKESFLLGSTTIKSVNESTWATTAITTYDATAPASTKAIVAGGPWHFVDFRETVLFFNGNTVIYRTNKNAMVGDTNLMLVLTSNIPSCGCAYKGRVILGGFPISVWQEEFDAICDDDRYQYTPSSAGNVLYYSRVGGGDLEWILRPTERPENWQRMLRENTQGFAVMPFQGQILAARQVGENLAVFGDDGIALLAHMVEPEPGLRVLNYWPFGIASRGALAGDEGGLMFVDQEGVLRVLSPDGQMQRLGYEEYFSPMLGTHIVGTFDPTEREYYLCNPTSGYVFRNGLGEIEVRTTGIAFAEGALVGITSGTRGQAEVRTHRFDMGRRSSKRITEVEIGARGLDDMEVMVRAGFGADPADTSWKLCNSFGNVRSQQAGTDFQLSIRADENDSTDAKLDHITVRFQTDDKRFKRGQ